MTGTNRFCVTTCLRAAPQIMLCVTMILLWTAAAIGQTRLSAPLGEDAGHNDFSATLSNDLPPNKYGGYQYQGPFPTSPPGRNLQFADSPPPSSSEDVPAGPDSATWGHLDIQQTQYPLSDPSPRDFDDRSPAEPSEPYWTPPLIAHPVPSPSAERRGWRLQADVPVEFTHVVGSGDTLGFTSLTGGVILETPRLPGFSVRPRFGWHLLDGPARTDLPAQLYDASVELRMYWPFGDRVLSEFAIAPSVFSDFENTSGDALRIVGRGVAFYRWSANLRIAGGMTYLDREDIRALPIVGLIWTPTPDDRLDLLFPQPKIAHRFRKDDHHERWIYLSGEFGGGSWAIERSTGRDDVATYRDLRLITGIEFKYTDKSSWRVEGGYVFGRELEYVSKIGDYKPRDTVMIRAAMVY